MDTTYVAECNGANVDNVLLRMGYLVHTVVPEMLWKEYGLNKLGVLLQSQFAVVHLVHFMLWITPLDPFFKSGFITLQTSKS